MDELEKLRKHWQDDDFQRKHALAREIVVNRLRELNREYEEKTGQGFVRFIETRMKTPESIAEKLQRKDYDVDFDTAVTALNDISGVLYLLQCQGNLLDCTADRKNRHIYRSKGKRLHSKTKEKWV